MNLKLGFSREQLLGAFAIAMLSSIEDVKNQMELGANIILGEFPS